ncbi:hypothetical protein [Rhodobacter maris]|uniref:PD(D/E)XK endonuclease domain-containing protein n=1 Tax=Rhodobacter maris TaxID=446682 RepID=A0A285RMX6_9RHOB|nr:hypothetical protein [Rhodobacter maris]SOB95234.1 hypothetical protein SAMN05877831_101858 [Rhodobacter maris]
MSQLVFPGLLPPLAPSAPLPFGAPSPLIRYPDVSGPVRATYAKRIGAAGEKLVDSLLTRWGFYVVAAPESEPYDCLVFVADELLRMQIKTVTHPRAGWYRFAMEQGYRRSPSGRRTYEDDAFDIAALVALPENVVFFTTEPRKQHRFPVSDVFNLRARPQVSFLEAIASRRERREIGS